MSTHLSVAFKVLNLQMADGAQGDGHTDDTKLHGKPDKTLRFSLCSDNLEGISEGWSAIALHVTHNVNRQNNGCKQKKKKFSWLLKVKMWLALSDLITWVCFKICIPL